MCCMFCGYFFFLHLLNEPECGFWKDVWMCVDVWYFIAFKHDRMSRLVKPDFTFICSDTMTVWVREGQRARQEMLHSHTCTHTHTLYRWMHLSGNADGLAQGDYSLTRTGHYDLNRLSLQTPSIPFIRHVRQVSAPTFLLHWALVAKLGSQLAVLHL